MQEALIKLLQHINGFVWGTPMLVLLVGTGVYLTILLRGIQFSTLYPSIRLALIQRKQKGEGDISHFQALMTALSATVGTGNIAGVATAIAAGGPGALFWMWITGLFGMATKYAEALLAVKYRIHGAQGTMSGGPMYYLSIGMRSKFLGSAFALFASVAAFGIGNMVQSNSVAHALDTTFGLQSHWVGLAMAAATAVVILGGIKSIGRTASALVPVMIVFYMIGGLSVIVMNGSKVLGALSMIFKHAFTPIAASGGFAGAAVAIAVQKGVSRGIFSNESGLGSSPIAAAAAQTPNPVTQALVSMTQTFIDTLVVCTITGLAILTSGAWESGLTGAELSALAFSKGHFGDAGAIIVSLGLVLFAYSTILGWSYYGEKSVEYLFGVRSVLPYRMLWILFVAVGAVVKLDLVWTFADVMNGLMAVPNLIGLLALSPVILKETQTYLKPFLTETR
jgi:AGCS family alanine or glycine:cation symporter